MILLLSRVACAGESTPETLVSRADSLRHNGSLVQSFSVYRNVASAPLTGCERARVALGMAAIHWTAGNLSEMSPQLDIVRQSCNTCPRHVRTPMALEYAELCMQSGATSDALVCLERELTLSPQPALLHDVELALAQLHFVEGHWQKVWSETPPDLGCQAEGLRLQAGALLGLPLSNLPLESYLHSAKPSNQHHVSSALTHLHTVLSSAGRSIEAWQLAQRMTSLHDPDADAETWTVAQLRVATSAEQAGEPLEALLAFHEASRVADQIDDIALRARIAREQARFEEERGATRSALAHLALADSLTLAMLHNAHQGREPRTFQSHPVMASDPFEIAAAKAMKPATAPGAWPFACALVVLGFLAASLRARELRKELRKERVRSLRMHRMLHHDVGHASEQSIALAGLGAPDHDHVEEALTRSDRLDFDDVIASLEMDHGAFVEWEFNSTDEGQHAPEGLLSLLSVTLKRLLEGREESHTFEGRIQNDWHGIKVEIEGPETASTRELQRMFAGGTHSSLWNPVLLQIERLAGRFTVEKRPSGELSLTFMLPHQGSAA